ncbi:hypothetical protein GCM10011511_55170 [Puia dinghuensis]|uniref:Thioesterase domain-containing protein n=2 Tax=Puia dinghuensis TaxID=1792502 RepID=A0A8J2UIV8_9BACT|nr:hypothetical protein GCM10011511_55170 [Puia dinghuensis]
MQLSGKLSGEPYALYGHSMGGLIACLLARKIVIENERPPVHIFVTGTEGPSAPSRIEDKRHLLNKEDFLKEIKDLDGCPDELLNDVELLAHFEPILRSDFKASETYLYEEGEPLDIPFTVLTGTEENMELADIELWQKETRLSVDFRRLPGRHFFIFDHAETILKIIVEKLSNNQKFIRHESVRKIS